MQHDISPCKKGENVQLISDKTGVFVTRAIHACVNWGEYCHRHVQHWGKTQLSKSFKQSTQKPYVILATPKLMWRKKAYAGNYIKLCNLPPASETTTENIKRARNQVVLWLNSMSRMLPPIDLTSNRPWTGSRKICILASRHCTGDKSGL